MKSALVPTSLALLLFSGPLTAQTTSREAFQIVAPHGPVLVEIQRGGRSRVRPAVLVLSGSRGFESAAYEEIAARFAAGGLDVFLTHFLSKTDIANLAEARDGQARKRYYRTHMPRWVASVRAVAASLAGDRPVGLLGISLGANVALASQSHGGPAGALVLVDGGAPPLARPPATLLIWARNDRVFPLATAHAVERAIEARGGSVKLEVYEEGRHDFFIRPGSSQAASAQKAAAAFLRGQLSR